MKSDISVEWASVSDPLSAAYRVEDRLHSKDLEARLGFSVTGTLSGLGWACGSNVWRAALALPVDPESDLDFVAVDSGAVEMILGKLRNRFEIGATKFGGFRLRSKEAGADVSALDVWHLPSGESICEHVSAFSVRHARVAYAIGLPSAYALVRATHEGKPPASYSADDKENG